MVSGLPFMVKNMSESTLPQTLKSALQQPGEAVSISHAATVACLTLAEASESAHPMRWFRHYKGGIYQLLMEVTFEADKLPMVIYRASNGTLWSRYASVFHESVEVEGKLVPRFSEISAEEALSASR